MYVRVCTCAVLQSSLVSWIAIKCAFVQLFIYITNFALSLKATLEILSNGIKNNRSKEWLTRERERKGRIIGEGRMRGSCKFKARHNIFYPSRVFRYQRDANNFGKSPRDFAPLVRLASPCHAWCLAVIAYRLLSTLFTYFKNPPLADSLALPPREGIG